MTESTTVATWLGALVGVGLDPVIIIAGGLLGLGAARWWQRILGSLVIALALTFAIDLGAELEGEMPRWWALSCRTIALIWWTAAGAALRWLIDCIQGY